MKYRQQLNHHRGKATSNGECLVRKNIPSTWCMLGSTRSQERPLKWKPHLRGHSIASLGRLETKTTVRRRKLSMFLPTRLGAFVYLRRYENRRENKPSLVYSSPSPPPRNEYRSTELTLDTDLEQTTHRLKRNLDVLLLSRYRKVSHLKLGLRCT